MRSARRKSLSPSRREIRNRHFRFLQIKNSSTPKTPLREDSFETAGEVGGSSKFSSWLPTIVFLRNIKFNPIKGVWLNTLRHPRALVIAEIAREYPAPTLTYVTESCSSAIPRTTYGQTRIGSPLPISPACATSSHRSRVCFCRSTFESCECNPAYLDNTESHFPRIGVPSAQRTGDTVSIYRRLKYRSCSPEEEQMP
jgi:hypothetical protein